MKKTMSLIVPCFNEAEALPFFYKKITDVCSETEEDYEVLFIDDGSTDDTLNIIKDLASKDPHICYFSFSRNFGKEAAMYAGFCNARGDYVTVIDADMQDPPELIPKMLEVLRTGEYDSVATRRESRTGEPRARSFFARLFYKVINKISDIDIVDGARDFRMMNRKMVDAVVSIGESNRFSKGLFGWIGFKTLWISYDNAERVAGKTKWSFRKLSRYAVDGMIDFSEVPLALSSWLGIVFSIIGFFAVLFIIVRKIIFGDPVAGWASTASIIVFIGGVQLFCLGIMGKYLSKIYIETKQRPHYIISETNRE